MTYNLLCYKDNSSSIVDWIRGKEGLNYKTYTIVHIMTYFLLCYKITVQLSLIELDKKMD